MRIYLRRIFKHKNVDTVTAEEMSEPTHYTAYSKTVLCSNCNSLIIGKKTVLYRLWKFYPEFRYRQKIKTETSNHKKTLVPFSIRNLTTGHFNKLRIDC